MAQLGLVPTAYMKTLHLHRFVDLSQSFILMLLLTDTVLPRDVARLVADPACL